MNRLWRLVTELAGVIPAMPPCGATEQDAVSEKARELRQKEHATVKKVGDDIAGRFQFNTAIAAVMELVNLLYLVKDDLNNDEAGKKTLGSALSTTLALLFPMIPHVCEELRSRLGFASQLVDQPWPVYSESALRKDVVTIVVQVNGKRRGKLDIAADMDEESVKSAALADVNVQKHLEGLTIRKVVFIPGKLVNVVAN